MGTPDGSCEGAVGAVGVDSGSCRGGGRGGEGQWGAVGTGAGSCGEGGGGGVRGASGVGSGSSSGQNKMVQWPLLRGLVGRHGGGCWESAGCRGGLVLGAAAAKIRWSNGPLLVQWPPAAVLETFYEYYQICFGLWLTYGARVMHIYVSKLSMNGSDNCLLPNWHQAIIWTNAGILTIRPLGTNCREILNKIYIFSLRKMHLKMSSAKWGPFCFDPNVLYNT